MHKVSPTNSLIPERTYREELIGERLVDPWKIKPESSWDFNPEPSDYQLNTLTTELLEPVGNEVLDTSLPRPSMWKTKLIQCVQVNKLHCPSIEKIKDISS